KKDFLRSYASYNLKFVDKSNRSLKIVYDAGNGMGGYTIPKIFKRVKNVKLLELYTNLDFSFPNHFPNPLKYETLKDLQRKVISSKADFGFATDGDADRVILVDERGQVVSSDILIALLSKHLLQRHPKGKIIYDLRSSRIVPETIISNGGKAIKSRVGHSYINTLMRKEKAVFGGELSGHLYFKQNNYTESEFIQIALVMNILSNGKRLSELLRPFRKYYSTGELNFAVKENKLKDIEDKYKKEAKRIDHLDGLTMYFDSWWFNLRKSNTEDLLRLNLEADTEELMERKKKELVYLIKK
ncbi:MAG TPA: phosphomannomutase/phosphoglucomutase, partial [Candidatus Nanoarchaeia archaeon]|nr:phosphomannomutase/phosphoglucomutase [Candidatus Nanoarchaeia archaeon]